MEPAIELAAFADLPGLVPVLQERVLWAAFGWLPNDYQKVAARMRRSCCKAG